MKKDEQSENIGASVIDRYSEGRKRQPGMAIRTSDINNDLLDHSIKDGGITTTMISPMFVKKRHLDGRKVVFEGDSNYNECETPTIYDLKQPFDL